MSAACRELIKSLAGAKPSWLSLLTNHGATWFTLVLHRAPLALDTNMLVYFRTLWHKFVIVWLLVSCGKCWYCMTLKHSGLKHLCFDVTQCQYLLCSSCNHIITNTCIIMCLTLCASTVSCSSPSCLTSEWGKTWGLLCVCS